MPSKRRDTSPLSKEELHLLGLVNVFIMDCDADGDTLPPEIQKISDLRRELTPAEARVLIDWFHRTARGSYS